MRRAAVTVLGFWSVLLPTLQSCRPNRSETETQAARGRAALEEMVKSVDTGVRRLRISLNAPAFREALAHARGSEMGLSLAAGGDQVAVTMERLEALWNKARHNPCSLWTPLFKSGGTGINHPYFFAGLSSEGGAGIHGLVGRDFVWDFYNMQFASFRYTAAAVVFGSGMVGVGGNGYVGLGFGVRPNVNGAWSGKFISAGLSGSLPMLSDYLSAAATGFVAADAAAHPDWSFLGGSLGVSISLSVPTAMPAALQTSVGEWVIEPDINRRVADRWRSVGLPVSLAGRETCDEQCVRFDAGRVPARYVDRAVNLARSIPLLVTSPGQEMLFPSFDKVLLLALATGAFRDTANAAQACTASARERVEGAVSPELCVRMNSLENKRIELPSWCARNPFALGVDRGFCARTTRNPQWVKQGVPQFEDAYISKGVGAAGTRDASVRVWVVDRKVHNAENADRSHLVTVKVRHVDSSLKAEHPETWMLPGYLEKSDDCGEKPADLR